MVNRPLEARAGVSRVGGSAGRDKRRDLADVQQAPGHLGLELRREVGVFQPYLGIVFP